MTPPLVVILAQFSENYRYSQGVVMFSVSIKNQTYCSLQIKETFFYVND